MSTSTPNLGLFKYDPNTDGAQTFNIQKALNENWDKVDAAMAKALANAESYDSTQTYALGDYCTVDGKLYKCTSAITEGEAWNPDHWMETSMSAELTELARQLSESGGLQMDLLWENASPTSEFAPQTLSMDLTEIEVVSVLCAGSAAGTIESCQVIVVGTASKKHPKAQTISMFEQACTPAFRNFEISNSGITFGKGIRGKPGDTTPNNGNCVPVEIYGIKVIT